MPTVNAKLLRYLRNISLRETDIQNELRQITNKLPEAGWEVSPEQAQFLALLVQITGAKYVLELGTFTGHSSLAMGLALPIDGKLITCDMEPKYTNIAEEFWIKAGIHQKIELRLGPAMSTLDELIEKGRKSQFDMAFIDANKKDYDAYYERVLSLIRPGGLIVIDNVFWGGRVLDRNNLEKSTRSIGNLNKKLKNDERISLSMLPLNDGVSLAWKRP
jgi:predicted O-methyltransferase YrrM